MSFLGIPEKTLSQFRSHFLGDPKNVLSQNVCTKQNPLDVLRKRSVEEETFHVFTHKVIYKKCYKYILNFQKY